MGKFLEGLLLGIGIGVLIAPQSGQETRRLLSERLQELRGSQLPQQLVERASQTASTVKDNTQQFVERASQTASTVKDNAQQLARQATDTVKDTAQKTTAQVKNSTNAGTQQVASQVQQTAQNLGNAAQQTKSNVEQASKQATQTVQAVPSPLSGPALDDITSGDNLLKRIPGIPADAQDKLEAQNIRTTLQLLDTARTKEERDELAEKTGIPTHTLKSLVTRADLMQVRGVSGNTVLLLEEAGVTNCKDLRHRNPEHLQARLAEVQDAQHIVTHVPDLEQVTGWIADAMRVVETRGE